MIVGITSDHRGFEIKNEIFRGEMNTKIFTIDIKPSTAKEIEKIRTKINALIAAETGREVAQVAKDTDRDYWLSADEAVQYGLITATVQKRSALSQY